MPGGEGDGVDGEEVGGAEDGAEVTGVELWGVSWVERGERKGGGEGDEGRKWRGERELTMPSSISTKGYRGNAVLYLITGFVPFTSSSSRD